MEGSWGSKLEAWGSVLRARVVTAVGGGEGRLWGPWEGCGVGDRSPEVSQGRERLWGIHNVEVVGIKGQGLGCRSGVAGGCRGLERSLLGVGVNQYL